MALISFWSAFTLIPILVVAFKSFSGDEKIFNRMVVGKADEPYDSVHYVLIGAPEKEGFGSRESFSKFLGGYGYNLKDSVQQATVLIAANENADSVKLLKAVNPNLAVYTYRSVQNKLVRKADGIIETCKSAVNIAIGLIGIMALFMGFMSIAEAAGGVRLLSRI